MLLFQPQEHDSWTVSGISIEDILWVMHFIKPVVLLEFLPSLGRLTNANNTKEFNISDIMVRNCASYLSHDLIESDLGG